ncbi:MAG: CHAD domain-containing protein [Kaiparowitsia implicata GSE-PSE-MK54-09C]|jgi:CHAD domain-containing protein|nr:CHAD domain-containing protein [Kaiparowitsia implicata GSE-PSE-MK54-09C]
MSKKQRGAASVPASTIQQMNLGEFAHRMIDEQFHHMVEQEAAVVADRDPEYLHQMRVGSRRLYTVLQVFADAIELPKSAKAQRVRKLTKVLGKLRDLDVQIDSLQTDYQPHLTGAEQRHLTEAIAQLQQQRRKALAGSTEVLSKPRYQDLKTAYENWLMHPRVTAIAQMPMQTLLPDLLTPLMARSLLHPGWLLPAAEFSQATAPILHDLRKACKHVRYQAEFFAPFYGAAFKAWMKDLRSLQDSLGNLQDLHVTRSLIKDVLPKGTTMTHFLQLVSDNEQAILSEWDSTRQLYLDAERRYALYHQLLQPNESEAEQAPENGQSAKRSASAKGRRSSRTQRSARKKAAEQSAENGTANDQKVS